MKEIWREQFDKLKELFDEEIRTNQAHQKAYKEWWDFREELIKKLEEWFQEEVDFKINWDRDCENNKEDSYEVCYDNKKVYLTRFFWNEKKDEIDYEDVKSWEIKKMF